MPIQPPTSRRLSLAGSIVLHGLLLATVLTLAAQQRAAQQRAGTTPESTRTVGLAVAHRMPDRTRYAMDQASATEESAKPTGAPSAGGSGPPASYVPPLDLNATLAAMLGQAESAEDNENRGDGGATGAVRLPGVGSADDLGDEQLVPGGPKRGQGNGQTTTSLFGVTGSGSTFVYVFDRSESMTGAALRRAKNELIESLQTLTENQQFQLIFYNHEPRSFTAAGSSSGLVLGDKSNLDRATGFIESITAAGGTEHELALRMALRLAPDVLFFLTDAKIQSMSGAAMIDISKRADEAGTVIHGIQFGSGPPSPDSFVRELASRNHGAYQYLDVTTLP